MRKPRGFLSRALISALTMWLGVVLTEPLPIDACPMHGAHSMHMAAQHHSMHTQEHGADRNGQTASHQCTCIGDCSVASGAAPASAEGIGLEPVISFGAPASFDLSFAVRRAAADHLRPFAIGPPPSSVA